MKFAITFEQRRYFRDYHHIEFEDMLSLQNIKELCQAIDTFTGDSRDPQYLYEHGHDMWRENDVLKRFTCDRRFAAIAAELTQSLFLRIAYDQYIPKKFLIDSTTDEPLTIEDISSIQGLACCLLLCLKAPSSTPEETYFPTKEGCGAFFFPNIPFDINSINSGKYLLITYAEKTASYQLNLKDVHTYKLKHLGCSYGSKLTHTHHPIIFPH